MVAQEWMINLNALMIVLLVVWTSHLVSRIRRVHSIFIGIAIASAGLLAAGFTMSGVACLLGIVCFSVGEMLSSPKMNDYLGIIAPEGKKGLYMGYANMPTAIGWAYGSFLAGDLYEKMGEKAGLALRYLGEHGGVPAGVVRTTAMEALQRVTKLDASGATVLLWNTYRPYRVWYPFCVVGIASAIGIFLYARWVRDQEPADI
jgi:MFS family permease